MTDNTTPDAKMIAARKAYIQSPRDKQLKDYFDWLMQRSDLIDALTGDELRPEARAVAVPGQSGAGKTTAIKRMLANHPDLKDLGQPSCAVIWVTAPAPCTLKTLGLAILEALGYPLKADRKEHEIWSKVRDRLKSLGTKVLVIDELQNVTSDARKNDAPRIRDTLKTLLNSPNHPVCLLLSGLPEIQLFLEEDTQIRRRTRFMPFRSFHEGDVAPIKGTMKTLAEIAGLSIDFSDKLPQRLIHAALGELGLAIEITLEAIELAIKNTDIAVDCEHYATAYARRTGNSADANPFVAKDWRAINASHVLLQDPHERAAIEIAKKAGATRRRRSPK